MFRSVRTLYKGVIHMQIMVGDSRLEQAAARMSDARAKEIERNEQQSLVQNMEEKSKKASVDGVVLEVSKAGVEDSLVKGHETEKVERIEEKKQEEQQKELVLGQQREQQAIEAGQRQVLENINIS